MSDKFKKFLKTMGIKQKHHGEARDEAERTAAEAGQGVAGSSRRPVMPIPKVPERTSNQPLTRTSIEDAMGNANHALAGRSYALVGGGACLKLGSGRATADIDILVRNGERETIKDCLKHVKGFEVSGHSGNQSVKFRGDGGKLHNVDVITAQDLSDKGYLPDLDPTMVEPIDGINVAKPQVMLLFKIISWMQRDKQEKRATDTQDISFLLGNCVEEKKKLGHHWVLYAELKKYCSEDFLDDFEGARPDAKKHFKELGLWKD